MDYIGLKQEVVDRLNIDATLSNDDIPYPFTEDEIGTYINKGYKDFLYLTDIYQKTSALSASSNDYYEFDKTYSKINAIMYQNKSLEIKEIKQLSELGRPDWRDVEDDEVKYAVWENMSTTEDVLAFRLYPKPSTLEDIYITYVPDLELSDDTDETVLPKYADEGIILFALSELLKQLGAYQDIRRSQMYYQEYARYIQYYNINAYTDTIEIAPRVMNRGDENG